MSIKWDRAAMARLDKDMIRALEMTGDVLRDEVREEQIVPRQLGTLQNEAFGVDKTDSDKGVVRLTFNTPYARRLYFHPEYNFSHDENPNAQGEWMTPWMPGGKYAARAGEIAAEILRRYV